MSREREDRKDARKDARENTRDNVRQDEQRTIGRLLADVAAGIRVLATRDGIALTEKQVIERARNIVAGLMGNYRILSFDSDQDDDEQERGAGGRVARGGWVD